MWCEFIFPVGMVCLDVYIYIYKNGWIYTQKWNQCWRDSFVVNNKKLELGRQMVKLQMVSGEWPEVLSFLSWTPWQQKLNRSHSRPKPSVHNIKKWKLLSTLWNLPKTFTHQSCFVTRMLPNRKLSNESCKLCVFICKYMFTACLGGEKRLSCIEQTDLGVYWTSQSWGSLSAPTGVWNEASPVPLGLCLQPDLSESCVLGTCAPSKNPVELQKDVFQPFKKSPWAVEYSFWGRGLWCLQQRQPGCALWSAFCWSCEVLYTLPGTGGVPLPSHPSLAVGLDICILTSWWNTSKTYVLMQFCELILFDVFTWLNAVAVLMWQCLQLFSTSFSSPQMVQLVPGKQKITFSPCHLTQWGNSFTESRSPKRQAQENFRTYVNVFFFKPLESY